MNAEEITTKIKGIPPIVWVIGAAVLLLMLFLGKGSSGSSGAVAQPLADDGAAGGGGGGGEFSPDIDQEVTDLFALIRQDQADRTAFQGTVAEWMTKNAVPTPSVPAVPVPVPTGPVTTPTLPTPTVPTPAVPKAPIAAASKWGADVPAGVRRIDPTGTKTAAKLKKLGIRYGTKINLVDIIAGLKKRRINYGTSVQATDLRAFLK